jgi:hypothetical protein
MWSYLQIFDPIHPAKIPVMLPKSALSLFKFVIKMCHLVRRRPKSNSAEVMDESRLDISAEELRSVTEAAQMGRIALEIARGEASRKRLVCL